MKVLCLHGYAENGPAFAKKCTEVVRVLGRYDIQPIFANAPIPVPMLGEDWETTPRRDLRAWWTIKGGDDTKYRIEKAIEALQGVINAHKPFSGVIGFSQGAALAGLLTENMEQFFPGHPPLLFGIYFSGFRVSSEIYQHYYDSQISVPTCHVIGDYDTIVAPEDSQKLVELCNGPRMVIKHPGSHFVPSSPRVLEQIDEFLGANLGK